MDRTNEYFSRRDDNVTKAVRFAFHEYSRVLIRFRPIAENRGSSYQASCFTGGICLWCRRRSFWSLSADVTHLLWRHRGRYITQFLSTAPKWTMGLMFLCTAYRNTP